MAYHNHYTITKWINVIRIVDSFYPFSEGGVYRRGFLSPWAEPKILTSRPTTRTAPEDFFTRGATAWGRYLRDNVEDGWAPDTERNYYPPYLTLFPAEHTPCV